MRIAIHLVRLHVRGIAHEDAPAEGDITPSRAHKVTAWCREYAVIARDSDEAIDALRKRIQPELDEAFASRETTWEPRGDRGDIVETSSSTVQSITGTSITEDEIRSLSDNESAEWLKQTVYRALGIAWSGSDAEVRQRHAIEISLARDTCAALWNHAHGFSVPGVWSATYWLNEGIEAQRDGYLPFRRAFESMVGLAAREDVYRVQLEPVVSP